MEEADNNKTECVQEEDRNNDKKSVIGDLDGILFVDRNLVDYRDSSTSTDEEEGEENESGEEFHESITKSAVSTLNENDDSDQEFNRILEICRKHRQSGDRKWDTTEGNGDALVHAKFIPGKTFDPEYYSLPPIENLNISVKDDIELKKFGVVDSHIDFIVKIKPIDEATHLGYETILFDSEKNPVGEIFEIFGTVKQTMYAIRFNSKEEAQTKLPIGSEIYYAISDETITKTVFPQELALFKNWDRFRLNPHLGASSSSEEVFSDDEKEREYMAKKRQKNRKPQNSGQTSADAPRVKRKKLRTQKELDSRRNPFHPQHRKWHQNRQNNPFPVGYYNNYPPYAYHDPYNAGGSFPRPFLRPPQFGYSAYMPPPPMYQQFTGHSPYYAQPQYPYQQHPRSYYAYPAAYQYPQPPPLPLPNCTISPATQQQQNQEQRTVEETTTNDPAANASSIPPNQSEHSSMSCTTTIPPFMPPPPPIQYQFFNNNHQNYMAQKPYRSQHSP